MPPRTVRVQLGPRCYDVLVGAAILSELGSRVAELIRPRSALLVIDDALPAPLVRAAEQSLNAAGINTTVVRLHASERGKSFAAVQRMVEAAAIARLERADAIIALGGGVIGDIAGLAASIYRRGIAIVQCPTTLLSMVDASVGGKTGVNLVVPASAGAEPGPVASDGARDAAAAVRLLKNMVGTFHQPRLVLADVHALRSLPHRHLRGGLAECIKHALMSADFGDDSLLAAIERDAPAIAAGRTSDDALGELIARNVAVKAAVVAGDEFEQGSTLLRPCETGSNTATPPAVGRESLNLGHTFGHALEAMQHLSPDASPANAPLHHGEAVGLGLIAATATAEAIGAVPTGSAERVRAIVESVGLPSRIAGLPGDAGVIAAMLDDKKVRGGVLRLVLPWRDLGHVRVAEGPPRGAVAQGVAAIRGG